MSKKVCAMVQWDFAVGERLDSIPHAAKTNGNLLPRKKVWNSG